MDTIIRTVRKQSSSTTGITLPIDFTRARGVKPGDKIELKVVKILRGRKQ